MCGIYIKKDLRKCLLLEDRVVLSFSKKNLNYIMTLYLKMRKEIEYYKTKILLMWLENREYKANLYMGLFSAFFTLIVHITVFYVLGNLFLYDLGFRFYDFIILFCLLMSGSLMWRLFTNPYLSYYIKRGNLNKMLTLPMSTIVYQMPIMLKGVGLVNSLIFLFLTIILSLFGNYTNYLLALFIYLSGYISQISIMNFIGSLSFFMKESSFVYRLYYHNVTIAVEDFTPIPFQNSFLYSIVAFLPCSLYGFFTLASMKSLYLDFIPIIILISLAIISVFSILTIINWKFGLKRYEAFGG